MAREWAVCRAAARKRACEPSTRPGGLGLLAVEGRVFSWRRVLRWPPANHPTVLPGAPCAHAVVQALTGSPRSLHAGLRSPRAAANLLLRILTQTGDLSAQPANPLLRILTQTAISPRSPPIRSCVSSRRLAISPRNPPIRSCVSSRSWRSLRATRQSALAYPHADWRSLRAARQSALAYPHADWRSLRATRPICSCVSPRQTGDLSAQTGDLSAQSMNAGQDQPGERNPHRQEAMISPVMPLSKRSNLHFSPLDGRSTR